MSRGVDGRAAIENLTLARSALLGVVEDLDERALRTQFHPEFSPIGWHLGHVAFQEEWFLLRRLGGRRALRPELDVLFDSFRSQKCARAAELPERCFLLEHAARVRSEVERLLAERGDDAEAQHLARFVANHERQHTEIVVSVRLLSELYLPALRASAGASRRAGDGAQSEWIDVRGGTFPLGTGADPDAADNEQRAHAVSVGDFSLARFPVTEAAWLEMMRAGGYAERRLWSEAGWAFLKQARVEAPLYWARESDGYVCRSLAGLRPAGGACPVCHVSFHEAEAFARFAGARLPSEAEWEYAASWDARRAVKRRYPWGDTFRAGLSDLELSGASPGPCGSHPEGRSAFGVEDLCGGVWEWTSSAFAPYPGFSPGAYAGYSAPWFDGACRVARGGSFATAKENARATFRNWYARHLRVPCLGVRLARG